MKTRKRKIAVLILVLLLALLFLTACKSTSTLTTNFKQGYGGLAWTILEGAPPDELYQRSDFKIVLKLENQGAYDITEGKIMVLGFDDKYIFIEQPEKNLEPLEGRNPFNPAGEIQFLEFSARSQPLLPGSEIYTAPYFVRAEYQYKTEFTPTVCLNPRLYEVYDAGCKVEPSQSFSGQGSPLAVTHLEEITIPGNPPQVEFRLTLQNKGRGQIKKIDLGSARLGNEPIYCEFRGAPTYNTASLTLTKEQKEISLSCKKTLKNQNSYATTLLVEFSFDYALEEEKSLVIKR